MIFLSPEQLSTKRYDELSSTCYLLIGDEPLLLQESQDVILNLAKKKKFREHYSITIEKNKDWSIIFNICNTISLFSKGRILLLSFSENSKAVPINEPLIKLASFFNKNIIFILRIPLNTNYENSEWFYNVRKKCVFIDCKKIKKDQLSEWVKYRANFMKIKLSYAANQLLCYCYEGNLLELSQSIERLCLIYLDGKITLARLEQSVHYSEKFTPFHWIDALLSGKCTRSWHILQNLKKEKVETIMLLRILQREMMRMRNLQLGMETTSWNRLFPKKIRKNRRNIITHALQRISCIQNQEFLYMIAKMEKKIKKNYSKYFWNTLENLSILLCSKYRENKKHDSFINHGKIINYNIP